MAVWGDGFDITLFPGAAMMTTTSQYRVACGHGSTTCVSFTPNFAPSTTALLRPAAVCLDQLQSGATVFLGRVLGITKILCSDSCNAFEWLRQSTSNTAVPLTAIATALTISTANIAAQGIIGQSLERGATGAVIAMVFKPSLIGQAS